MACPARNNCGGSPSPFNPYCNMAEEWRDWVKNKDSDVYLPLYKGVDGKLHVAMNRICTGVSGRIHGLYFFDDAAQELQVEWFEEVTVLDEVKHGQA